MQKMTKYKPLSAKEQAYRELKEALLNARFAPGEQVTVKALSEELGMGTMPVRESVQRLVAEGGLEIMSNRLVRVAEVSAAELAEISEIRRLLESLAVTKACRNATAAELVSVGAAWERFGHCLESADADNFLAANKAFHFAIYRASGAQHLIRLIELMWLKTGPILGLRLEPSGRKPGKRRQLELDQATYDIHAQLAQAVMARDERRAGDAIHGILDTAADWMMAVVKAAD